jgi:hypothetical protein
MLFVGDDWAEDHHDIEIEDEDGRQKQQHPLAAVTVGVQLGIRGATRYERTRL